MENGVPNYLKEYLFAKRYPQTLDNEFIITGSIRCTCGANDFHILREKEEQTIEERIANKQIFTLINNYKQFCESGQHIGIINREDKYYIAKIDFNKNKENLLEDITELNKKINNEQLVPIFLKAICVHCGKEILIFDSSVNGYNGLLNSSNMGYKKAFSIRKRQKCRKCGNKASQIDISISNTGKHNLRMEHSNLLVDCNWEDAFDWLTVDLKCSGCGRLTKKYLDVETM